MESNKKASHPIFGKTIKISSSHINKRQSPDKYLSEEDDENSGWEWYDPPEDSPPVNFFMDTSLHGLQYLGQRKRHLCERIFWLCAFIIAVVTAIFLIWQMWSAYVRMPIVTVFNPTEKTISEIPFPAVTICNVNNVVKSKVNDLLSKAKQGIVGGVPKEDYLQTLSSLLDIYNICGTGKSFIRRFVNSTFNDVDEFFKNIDDDTIGSIQEKLINRSDTTETLRRYSQSCNDMIHLCVWLDGVQNCSNIFQEIETDYGYCCTFNTIPISLLMKDITDLRDDPERVKDWADANIDYDNLMFSKENYKRKHPKRQKYPGRSAGLSVILIPGLNEYFCPNTDSDGFMVALNVPLDFPRMRDRGIAVRTNSEVFISVRPEITMSDDSANQFDLESRNCYLSHEKKLRYYTKYTTSNCMDECIAIKTSKKCGCVRYYMPNSESKNEMHCRPSKFNCTENVREEVVRRGIGSRCTRCLPTCTEITYHAETTTLGIRQDHVNKLFQQYPDMSSAQDLSIVHVYFDIDSTYPRLRKETTGVINLISNAGGLLGFCMGFSMLSLLEIVYHATIRLFWKSYRKRSKEKKMKHLKTNCQKNLNLDYNGTNSSNLSRYKSCVARKKNRFLLKVLHWRGLERGKFIRSGRSNVVESNDNELPPPYNPYGSDIQTSYFKMAWTPPGTDVISKTANKKH